MLIAIYINHIYIFANRQNLPIYKKKSTNHNINIRTSITSRNVFLMHGIMLPKIICYTNY